MLLCFFHFSQALWKKAGILGLREKSWLVETKKMIMNLQLMSFMDIEYKVDHYERVRTEFVGIDQKFEEFLNYFELTWMKGHYFKMTDWNYFRAIKDEDEIELSKSFHITNNAVESCNAILNSCLNRGMI